jgi:hypothetical protein
MKERQLMESAVNRRQTIEKSVRISVSLPADQHTALTAIAKDNRVSLAWVVRTAVEEYLSNKTPLFNQKG